MAFYHGRGTAFWQPPQEGAKDLVADALALFPSEPAGAELRGRHEAEPAPAPDPQLEELQGLAVHLNQTCGRIEELAERTEDLLRRVERLTASATRQIERTAPRSSAHPLRDEARKNWTRLASSVHAGSARARSELHTQALLAQMAVQRRVRAPLRDAAARLRKRVVFTRATTAVQLEEFATKVIHAATTELEAPGVTVVIRHSPPMTLARSAIVSASSGMIFAALVSGLVLVAAVPTRDSGVRVVAEQRLSQPVMPSSVPATLDSILNLVAARPVAAAATMAKPPAIVATSPDSRQFYGSLRVESEPVGAAVFVNRELVGETPITLNELRAGSRAVWVESDGYQRWSAGVLVPADKQTRISVKLQRDPREPR